MSQKISLTLEEVDSDDGEDVVIPPPLKDKIPVIPRHEWSQLSATEDILALDKPIEYVLFTIDDGNTVACKTREDCLKSLRLLEHYYINEKKLPDIPYNFIVAGDLNVYEGRGWDLRPQKSRKYPQYADKTVDVGIITGHENEYYNKRVELEHATIDLATEFIRQYVDDKIISKDFEFVGFTGSYIL